MLCFNCQTDLPAQVRFCMNCGQPVSEIAQEVVSFEAERRAVTILFADISGFTAMVEGMGAEEVRSFINGCFDHLVPIIEKYGGTIDKFIGDEIMALFGAPVAHEDDPARALCAALDIMAELKKYNAERGTNLGLHVGINTGLAVAGGIGSRGRQQYSVIGSAVNLAARLESVSERGEILVGPDTYRLTAPLFEFKVMEPVQIKGRVEPVQVYKVSGAKAQPGRLRGLAGLASPMVGRDAELAALLKMCDALQNGQRQVAIVIGEAGLGKSRLMTEWRAEVRRQKAEGGRRKSAILNLESEILWVEGRCLSYGQGLAYHLLIDLLHALIGVPASADEPDTNAALWALTRDLFGDAMLNVYPYLGHLLSLHLEGEALERVGLLDPQTLQTKYLAALCQLLQALAARRPVTLIFEDIHWADPSSTELLIKLTPLVADHALLFCFVTRPDQDTPGWKLVTTVRESMADSLIELNLHNLSEGDSRQLVSNLLEIEALPEHVRSLILKKAEGNPFFVEEVIRMLIDREAIVREDNRWAALQEIQDVEIPDNLHGLLLARIDRLPDDVKHTLRVASVIGRQFAVRVLKEVLQSI